MDVNGLNCFSATTTQIEEDMDLRRGPWTVEEDLLLMNYIANHGEGRWNSLARSAGLKRTGKSCRLRWLNYLRPDVRRGNITLEEQLTILELHSRWGNRWSKIAQHLPGRTDNEIKNYWRTRVQKHAKQLRCDVNSKLFKDTMRYQWMPRLVERIRAAAASASTGTTITTTGHTLNNNPVLKTSQLLPAASTSALNDDFEDAHVSNPSFTRENSCTAASSDSLGTQVSPVSDLTDYYHTFPADYNPQIAHVNYPESLISPSAAFFNPHALELQGSEQNNTWLGSEDLWATLWNDDEDMFFFQ